LIDINAHTTEPCPNLDKKKESQMPIHDLEVVIFIVCAFSLFGGVLAWASWDEARGNRK